MSLTESTGGEAQASTGGSSGDGVSQLLQEATMLMKSLRPSLKAVLCKEVIVAKASAGQVASGLLDGGATNVLRQGSTEEIAKASMVDVELATGTARLYQCMETGSLLTKDPVEPIVPVRGLISLGYKIQWDANGCVISHPQHGRIRSWLRNGCPVVRDYQAMQLIEDIENQEKLRRMGPRLALGVVDEETKTWWRQRFPQVPDSVLDFMGGQNKMPSGDQLPWNRGTRKRFWGAKGLIIHLFSGNQAASKEWSQGWPPGIEVVTVDVDTNPQQNLHSRAVWGFLCHLVKSVPVVAVVGGPPCRSISRLRNIAPGPPPLRGRLEERFGLVGLSKENQVKADGDAALLLKQQGLYIMACESQKKNAQLPIGYMLESPEDPAAYARNETQAPTFWAWPEVQSFGNNYGMRTISFDQGCLGHVQVKPTTCMIGSLPGMLGLDGLRCGKQHKHGEG